MRVRVVCGSRVSWFSRLAPLRLGARFIRLHLFRFPGKLDGARPDLRRATSDAQPRARRDDGYAERGGRLLPAFAAMADKDHGRIAGELIADCAALAAAQTRMFLDAV